MSKETKDKKEGVTIYGNDDLQNSGWETLKSIHNTAIDSCIEVVKELYSVQISTDSDGNTYHNHPVPTEKYLTERLQLLKK